LQKLVSLSVLSLVCVAAAQAGKAPLIIVAAETPQNMAFNATQVITYTVHNNSPSPIKINLAANRTHLIPTSPLITWNFSDDCIYRGMADYVPPNGNCDVNLSITSLSQAGQLQQSVNINYGPSFQNITPAPAVNITVNGGGSGGGLFFTTEPTGQDMLVNSTQDIIWTVRNSTASAIPLVAGGTNFTVASTLIATPVFSNDCNNSVPGSNGICHIQASIQSLSTAGNVSQYLAVTYNTNSKLVVDSPTNFNISGSSPGVRSFSLVNKCSYPVWFSFAGGGISYYGCNDVRVNKTCDQLVPNATAGTFACNNTAVGPAPNNYIGQCTWKNPVASSYLLKAKTGTTTVQIPQGLYTPTPPQPEVWSGTISGRTGCPTLTNPGTQCLTGDCGGVVANVTGGCTTGISPPNIQAETTLQTNTDFYDITSINGINVPMSMEPVNASLDANNPYHCGGAGIATSQTASYGTIGGCPWTFTPPSNNPVYNWIETAGATCSANSNCNQAGGEACGLTKSDIQIGTGSNATHCGIWLGYWTPDEVCVANSSYAQAPYNCASTCTGPDCSISTSYTALYGCSGGVAADTCYSNPLPSPLTNCCGCQNWQDAPYNIQIPSNPLAVTQCDGAGNAGWASIVLPQIAWLKNACPSMYSYPHDDPASSFQCTSSVPSNAVNYRITFCPGSSDGAPSGTIPNQ
jgi:hypothetical protein